MLGVSSYYVLKDISIMTAEINYLEEAMKWKYLLSSGPPWEGGITSFKKPRERSFQGIALIQNVSGWWVGMGRGNERRGRSREKTDDLWVGGEESHERWGNPRGKADSWWVGNGGRGNEKGVKLRRKADLKDSRFKQFKQFGECKLGSLWTSHGEEPSCWDNVLRLCLWGYRGNRENVRFYI